MNKKIVFLSSYPPRECGIATFTKDLSDSIQKKFGNVMGQKVVAINESPSALYNYPTKVSEHITQEDPESYRSVARRLNRMRNVDVVNIQHEFGLYGGDYGEYLFNFMDLLKKNIVTTMHTVLEHPDDEMKAVVQKIFEKSDKVVVMTDTAKDILERHYDAPPEKIRVIPHGVPSIKFENKSSLKKKYGITHENIILTFGLLSRGKGIEKFVNAMPAILKKFPDTAYIVVGETHPRVREEEGESYRQEIKEQAVQLGVEGNIKFIDKFLTLSEIVECLNMADVYVSSSLDKKQICSGTISYAMGAGKAIVCSKNKYNEDVLGNGRGIVLENNGAKGFSESVVKILEDKKKRNLLERNAFEYSRKMTWPNVSTQYFNVFAELSPLESGSFSRLPRVNFKHFSNITDDFGMIQFCKYSEPDIESGYTLDDNARALSVAILAYEKFGSRRMLQFADKFLTFVEQCQMNDGRFHNLLDGNREFIDDVGSEDSFGRAVCALGHAVQSNLPLEYKLRAKNILEKSLAIEEHIHSPRAQADIIIGVINSGMSAEENKGEFTDTMIQSLVEKYQHNADENWKWFEEYMTYANSRIPEALFYASEFDKSGQAEKIAKESIDFLSETHFIEGKLLPIGQKRWFVKDKERAIYDQQPIEAAGMTTAYLKAYEKTKINDYLKKARDSFNWFLGKNSRSQVVYDEATGGCFDGLTRTGVNANEGAESTVSYLTARLSIQ